MPENAAGRKPEFPEPRRIPNADTAPTPVIRYEDFLAAQRDPKVKRFLAEAKAEGEQLRRDGLIHF